MPKTLVKCSLPYCEEEATTKIAAPWVYGRFEELKTYGYACADHVDEVVDRAGDRPKPPLAEGESLGEIGTYALSH